MTTSAPNTSSSAHSSLQAYRVQRVALFAFVTALTSGLLAVFVFIRTQVEPNRAVLVMVAIWILYMVLSGASVWLSRRGRPLWAAWLIMGGLLVNIPLSAIFVARVGMVAGVGLVLLILAILAQMRLPQAQTRRAIVAAIVLGVTTLVLDLYGPPDRQPTPAAFRTLVPVTFGFVMLSHAVSLARQRRSLGLQARLIAGFLVVSLVPAFLLAIRNDRAARRLATESANQALLGAASETATRIDDYIDNTLDIVETEARLPAFQNFLLLRTGRRPVTPQELEKARDAEREAKVLLPILAQRDWWTRSYWLLDEHGQVVVSTTPLDLGLVQADQEYFRVPWERGQAYISAVDFARSPTEGDIYFSAQVRHEALGPVGVLVARYSAGAIQSLVKDAAGLAGKESFAVVFDENLVHVAHSATPETNYKFVGPAEPERVAELQASHRLPMRDIGELSTQLPELEQHLAEARDQFEQRDNPPPAFFAAEDVATGDRWNQVAVIPMAMRPWLVGYFQPQDVFLAPIETQSRGLVLMAVLIAILVSWAAVRVSQWLTNPISRLTAVAEKVSAGDLRARASPVTGDEIGVLAATFDSMTGRLQDLVGTLERRVDERTAHLQAAADIGRTAASVRDLDTLLHQALELIRERFGLYHASIFLLDETGRVAALRESTGEVGAQLKAGGHALAVGSKSLVGWVTEHRRPRAALDVADDPFHFDFNNPLLPEARSELAIPLIVGGRLLGALDVLSTELRAFGDGDVQVLQTLADQLSVAIENAELFQQTQARLTEMSALYQRVTGASWRAMLRGQPRERVYEVTPGGVTGEGGAPLQVPLRLRDEVVGVIEVHGRRAHEWTPEERGALKTIAAQLVSALESAALLEETQRHRMREQLINQITEQIRASLNPAVILQSGIRELGRALRATEVVVSLTSAGKGDGGQVP